MVPPTKDGTSPPPRMAPPAKDGPPGKEGTSAKDGTSPAKDGTPAKNSTPAKDSSPGKDCTHPPPVNRMIDRCKNITFPELRLQAVKISLECTRAGN